MSHIDLRTAVQKVRDYIVEFNDLLGNNLEDAIIEETELSDGEKFWLITIGFNREVDPRESKTYTANPLFPKAPDILPRQQTVTIERVYKIFKVDSSTGEVVSMKIYQL